MPGHAAAGAVAQGGAVVVQQQLRAPGRHRGQREELGDVQLCIEIHRDGEFIHYLITTLFIVATDNIIIW